MTDTMVLDVSPTDPMRATAGPSRLGRGDVLLVPRGRLHGLSAVSGRAGVTVATAPLGGTP